MKYQELRSLKVGDEFILRRTGERFKYIVYENAISRIVSFCDGKRFLSIHPAAWVTPIIQGDQT